MSVRVAQIDAVSILTYKLKKIKLFGEITKYKVSRCQFPFIQSKLYGISQIVLAVILSDLFC